MVSRYRSLIVLAVVLLSQLLLLAYQMRRDQDIPLVRYGTTLVVTPLQKGIHAVVDGVGGAWYGYVDLRGARRENEALARQLEQLKLQNHRLREQADEARRLQALFNLREQLTGPTLVARVIGASSAETARMVTINRGQNDGIEPDLPVLVADGIVGKVLHVFPDAAQVLLITDPYSGVAGLLEDSRVHGVLKGQNQLLLKLDYVPNGDEVRAGQRVYTSGEDQIFPKGLPVGVVEEARPGLDFQEITVRPLAPMNRLEEVLVILKGGTQEMEITAMPPSGKHETLSEMPEAPEPAASPQQSSGASAASPPPVPPSAAPAVQSEPPAAPFPGAPAPAREARGGEAPQLPDEGQARMPAPPAETGSGEAPAPPESPSEPPVEEQGDSGAPTPPEPAQGVPSPTPSP